MRTLGLDWKTGDVVIVVNDYVRMRRSARLPYGYTDGLAIEVDKSDGRVQYNILPETLQVIAEKIAGDKE